MKTKEYKEYLRRLFLNSFKEEKLPWVKEWNTGRKTFGAYNYVSKRQYNGANRFVLEVISAKEGYKTNAFMTFNQAANNNYRLDGAKGKGIPINFWFPYDTIKKVSITWDEYKKLVSQNADENIAILQRIYHVFNARHMIVNKEGMTLEEAILKSQPKRVHTKEDITLADAVLNNYCKNEGINILHGGDSASYNPLSDEIKLPEREAFSADTFYVSTKAHECAHSTGHESRLNRKLVGAYERDSYAVEELRAEISAAFLCADFDLPQMGKAVENSKAYIQFWIDGLQDKPDVLLKALDQAEKISAYIKQKGDYAGLFGKEEAA